MAAVDVKPGLNRGEGRSYCPTSTTVVKMNMMMMEEEEEDAKTKSRIKTFCKIGCDIKVKLTQGCFKFANSFQCSGSDGDCPGAMTIVMIMIMIMTMMMKIMIILSFLINYHQHYLHHK